MPRHRNEPRYSPRQLVSRILSAVIALAYVIAATVIERNAKMTILVVAAVLVPVLLIWFPDRIGRAKGYMINRQWVDEPTPPILISGMGWFFLVVLPAFLLLSWKR